MSTKYASSKNSISTCDRCGFQYKLTELKALTINLKITNILVCRSCFETDHPQYHLGRYPVYDPQAVRNPRPDTSYVQSGLDANGLPADGSRIFQWGWRPVGGPANGGLTPNTLTSTVIIGTVIAA